MPSNRYKKPTNGNKLGKTAALSRVPAHNQVECDKFVPGVKPTDLPCGGCNYCVRADSQWETFNRQVDDASLFTLLDPSSTGGVVHNAGVLGARGNDQGGLGIPLVGDTVLGKGMDSAAQQTYQVISAETVGVGASNQIRHSGKPECLGGGASEVDKLSQKEQFLTTQYERVITGSLLADEQSVKELRTKDSQESFVEVLWNLSGTVDVNLFKPVATVCDVGAPKQEQVLSCWDLMSMK